MWLWSDILFFLSQTYENLTCFYGIQNHQLDINVRPLVFSWDKTGGNANIMSLIQLSCSHSLNISFFWWSWYHWSFIEQESKIYLHRYVYIWNGTVSTASNSFWMGFDGNRFFGFMMQLLVFAWHVCARSRSNGERFEWPERFCLFYTLSRRFLHYTQNISYIYHFNSMKLPLKTNPTLFE